LWVGLVILVSILGIHLLPLWRSLRESVRPKRPLVLAFAALAGCTAVGPTSGEIERAPAVTTGVRIIPVTEQVAEHVNHADIRGDFATRLGDATPIGTRVGVGDTLEVTIWEAAPAALFGTAILDSSIGSGVSTSRPNTLPGILVGPSGTITIPFAGQVPAAGRTLRQIEQEIVRRLQGRAHLPQAMVRVAHNATANVTVVGDVKSPQRIPLTPRGERVLDAIAQAGGTSQPIDRMTIEISRGGAVQRMAARDLLQDPRQNIILRSDDVITALYQPYSFTVMGATGKNDEVHFEGVGLTLAQALGRVGGLQDMRADPRGVFLFRWERPQPLGSAGQGLQPNQDGLVPVIYQADLKRPETYFAVQHFRMRDGDIIYVSNSRVAELQRFLNILSSSILPVATARTIAP